MVQREYLVGIIMVSTARVRRGGEAAYRVSTGMGSPAILSRSGVHVAEVEGEALDLISLQPDIIDDDVVVRRLRGPLEAVVRAHVEVELSIRVRVRVRVWVRVRVRVRVALGLANPNPNPNPNSNIEP